MKSNKGFVKKNKAIKCVVWDLDNTIWEGILSERDSVYLKEEIVEIIKILDSRGILQTIASRNNMDEATEKLKEFNIDHYFLYPQINWSCKSHSIKQIIHLLNIGSDAVAFVDDQVFEREEVSSILPDVICISPSDLQSYIDLPEFKPEVITKDSSNRRSMYINDALRNEEEENFKGSKEEFLASLNMILSISSLEEKDLDRAKELTVRTNQLNSTGYTYSSDELNELRNSDQHMVLMAELEDKYGKYGKIGLALIELGDEIWTIKLLLMSCRVMSRGVGTILLYYIMNMAKEKKVHLQAEFLPNDKNRMMYVTFRFNGFKEIEETGDRILLSNSLTKIPPYPKYITLHKKNTCTGCA